MMVKQLGGWRSDAIVQGYIDKSKASRNTIFDKLAGIDQNVFPSTSGQNNLIDKINYDEFREIVEHGELSDLKIVHEFCESDETFNQNIDKRIVDQEKMLDQNILSKTIKHQVVDKKVINKRRITTDTKNYEKLKKNE